MKDVEKDRQILFIIMWNYATKIKSGTMFSCSKWLPRGFFDKLPYFMGHLFSKYITLQTQPGSYLISAEPLQHIFTYQCALYDAGDSFYSLCSFTLYPWKYL